MTAADRDAHHENWARSDRNRTLQTGALDYDADQIAGFDHDIGAVLVKATTVTREAELAAAPEAWSLRPEQFPYPWQTDDPK